MCAIVFHRGVAFLLRYRFLCAWHTAVFTQPFCCAPVAHWNAFGRASPHCISWYQIQLILTMRYARDHSALWDNRNVKNYISRLCTNPLGDPPPRSQYPNNVKNT